MDSLFLAAKSQSISCGSMKGFHCDDKSCFDAFLPQHVDKNLAKLFLAQLLLDCWHQTMSLMNTCSRHCFAITSEVQQIMDDHTVWISKTRLWHSRHWDATWDPNFLRFPLAHCQTFFNLSLTVFKMCLPATQSHCTAALVLKISFFVTSPGETLPHCNNNRHQWPGGVFSNLSLTL